MWLQPLLYVLKHSRRQNAENSCHAESRAIPDYLVREEIEIRSHSNKSRLPNHNQITETEKTGAQTNETPGATAVAWIQYSYRLAILHPSWSYAAVCCCMMLYAAVCCCMLLYAFRSTSVLFHCNFLKSETKIGLRNVGCFENVLPLSSREYFITKSLFSTQLCRKILKFLWFRHDVYAVTTGF